MAHSTWTVRPTTTPRLKRPCARCHEVQPFESSDAFRVNCNGSRLDVWLIYRCTRCESRWNAPLVDRAPASSLEPDRYEQFLQNDSGLAWQLAFDPVLLRRWGAPIARPPFEVERSGDGPRIAIAAPYPNVARLDRVLARGLQTSRSAVTAMADRGELVVRSGRRALRRLVRGGEMIEWLS